MRHDECQACMGNVMDGMSCYTCGLKGPRGDGWVFMAQDLKARVAELEAEVEALRARLGAAQDPTNVMLAYESETWPEGDEEGEG